MKTRAPARRKQNTIEFATRFGPEIGEFRSLMSESATKMFKAIKERVLMDEKFQNISLN